MPTLTCCSLTSSRDLSHSISHSLALRVAHWLNEITITRVQVLSTTRSRMSLAHARRRLHRFTLSLAGSRQLLSTAIRPLVLACAWLHAPALWHTYSCRPLHKRSRSLMTTGARSCCLARALALATPHRVSTPTPARAARAEHTARSGRSAAPAVVPRKRAHHAASGSPTSTVTLCPAQPAHLQRRTRISRCSLASRPSQPATQSDRVAIVRR